MMIKKKQFALLIYLLLIVAFCILFIPSKHILAEEEQASSRAYCYLCKYKKSDGLMYIKERQFYQKVEALKEAYGESVDKVALTAAVMHRYGTDGAYNKVYESNFDETSYKARAKGLSKLMQASSADSASLTEEESIAVRENEKIDLLTIAALVMVDSNHHGTYSDVCFKQGLAGNRLVGNDNDSIFGTVLNAITCKQQEIKLPDGSSYEGDSDRVIAASNKIRLQNLKKVCNNGFVGGLYEGISQMSDGSQKETKKKLYAQQIIDLANYYKKLYGKKEEANCNINIAGATGDFASWKQYDSKWGNVIMGDTPNVSKYGCMVTSIAMQIARSGTRIGELPSGYNEFNPGAFVTSLSSHGGFVEKSANFSGTGYQTIAPNWKMLDMVEGNYSDDSNFANLISKELSEAYDGQYQKFIILRIKATGHDQHWVAVNGVENGHVTVFDPGSAGKTPILSENYNNLVITGYKVMYATDVKFGQTGNTTNNTCETSYGTGDIKIPAQYGGGGYTVTEIDQWNWLYDCGKVYREWLSKGAKTDNGIATIDGRYLIACTSTFGKVGDKIDFFLDDGTRIPAIMFDTKNPNDAGYNQWGHDGGANVLEFEVLSSYYHRYGNPGSTTWFPQWHGKRVSSATNLGSGGSSQVSSSSNQVSNNVCETKRDGKLIAKLAVAVAPTATPDSRISVDHYKTKSNDSRAKAYNDIFYQTIAKYPSDGAGNPNAKGDGYNNPAYASCVQAAAAIIRATVDPDISSGNPTSMELYLKSNSDKWTKVGEIKAGENFADKCKPGDLLLTVGNSGDSGHAMIYVGKYAKDKFQNTSGVVWEAANDMSGKYLYPGITDKKSWGATMAIWRPTGKGNFYYPFIDISKYVDADVICDKTTVEQTCVNGQAVSGDGINNNFDGAEDIFFNQCDGDWKNLPYWFNSSRTAYSGSICGDGCGLVATTVAIDILKGQRYTPTDVYKMRDALGNIKYEMVAADAAPRFNEYNTKLFGIRSENLDQDVNKLKNVLQKGGVIVASFGNDGDIRPWHLADGSIPNYQHDKYHFVCIWAYKDGKFLLKDSSASKELGNNVGYTDSEMEKLFSSNSGGSMWAVYSVGNSSLNYSEAVTIPDSLWKSHDSSADPSIVVVDSNGNVLAHRNANLRREGGSTTKVFAGYAALKLLKPNDTITGDKYVMDVYYSQISAKNRKIKSDDLKTGKKISVKDAATRSFPGSYNVTADNIPLAIGRKYYSGLSNKETYSKGLQKMNELYAKIGCNNTKLGDGSGINGIFDCTRSAYDSHGINKDINGTGFSANDLALVTIEAMKDNNFAEHFGDRNKEGKFFIKSGTQYCTHGVWGFNKNGKRYYIVILGIKCGNTSSGAKYAIATDVYNWTINNILKKK